MAHTDTITMIVGNHGEFQTDAAHFDLLMVEYVMGGQGFDSLMREIGELSPDVDYGDLTTISECLMVLAELRGYATN